MMLLGLVLWFAMPSGVQASDRFWLGVNLGGVQPYAQRVWTPGTYVTRTENVLVVPAHYEDRWVPPLVEIRHRSSHPPVTIVLREGYYEKVLVPARYELREVRQWVRGCWREGPIAAYRPSSFGFSVGGHDDRRDYRRDDGHDRRDRR
jgi:hypothetical protein